MSKLVDCIKGDSSIIIVCPHGKLGDDDYTDVIGKTIANQLDASAIINHGWNRGESIDKRRKIANFNSIKHCIDDSVSSEFYFPYMDSVNEALSKYKQAHIFLIHGMKATPGVDVVLGYGEGLPPSYSCEPVYKDEFGYRLSKMGLKVFQGKAGGKYSAHSKDNLCQYFRQHKPNYKVQSIQIEISSSLRMNKTCSQRTGKTLAQNISDLIYKNVKVPYEFKLGEL